MITVNPGGAMLRQNLHPMSGENLCLEGLGDLGGLGWGVGDADHLEGFA